MYDGIVIGAGIIGLSTAYHFQKKFPDKKILIIEKEKDIAQHQTGRNSGVIHSGIYYKTHSLKAKKCLNGYQKLIDYAQKNSIAYELCGKIIVATEPSELPSLEHIYNMGCKNGLKGLSYLNKKQIKEKEPYCEGIKGIWVPQTGIIDYIGFCKSLLQKIENRGGVLKTSCKVINIVQKNKETFIQTTKGDFKTQQIINCAGLYSDKICSFTQDKNFQIIPFRGEYYKLKEEKKYLVNNLIYPVPNTKFPFLGTHFTRTITGEIKAGPNAVLAFAKEGYTKKNIHLKELYEIVSYKGFQKVMQKYWRVGLSEVYHSFSKNAFTKSLQKLLPQIQENDLVATTSGVRAQACDKNGLIDDFIIQKQKKNHKCRECSLTSSDLLPDNRRIHCKTNRKFMKIATVIGARPQFIKASVVSREIQQREGIEEILIHTGQHYDHQMSEIFFEQMNIPKPKYNLGIGGFHHGKMTGRMMEKIETIFLIEKPDWVLVYGDTNSTLAGALVAVKLHIKLAHIEAGLRSFDMNMPEEINRILTDRMSNVLFCPSKIAVNHLKNEGFGNLNYNIVNSGDVMKDATVFYKNSAIKPSIHLEKEFILATIHRPFNVDNKENLTNIIKAMNTINEKKQVILALHPRTKKRIKEFHLQTDFTITEPVGYLEMAYLLSNAQMVITDSGGLQKEAYFFEIPCMVLRNETEWVELTENNFSVLTGSNYKKIMHLFDKPNFNRNYNTNIYGNGNACKKIINALLNF